MTEYVVIYEEADDRGWGAYLPDVPGVVALGDTLDETTDGIHEAFSAYVDDLRERGLDLPKSRHLSGILSS